MLRKLSYKKQGILIEYIKKTFKFTKRMSVLMDTHLTNYTLYYNKKIKNYISQILFFLFTRYPMHRPASSAHAAKRAISA